jgi:hypothetical protein
VMMVGDSFIGAGSSKNDCLERMGEKVEKWEGILWNLEIFAENEKWKRRETHREKRERSTLFYF